MVRKVGEARPTDKDYDVILQCLHHIVFPMSPPKRGELILCRRCGDYKTVIVTESAYKVRCKGCRYTRLFGVAKLKAEGAAIKHRQRYPWHVVQLWDGKDIVHTYQGDLQATLPLDTLGDPPF